MLFSGSGCFPALTHRLSVDAPIPSRLANWVPLMQWSSAMGVDRPRQTRNGPNRRPIRPGSPVTFGWKARR
jgi:hypothetical protein